jgi:hypothetical protein
VLAIQGLATIRGQDNFSKILRDFFTKFPSPYGFITLLLCRLKVDSQAVNVDNTISSALNEQSKTFPGRSRIACRCPTFTTGKPTEASLDAKTLKSFVVSRARKGHALEPKMKDAKLTPVT